jgi:hypothetical protein
MMGPQTCLAVRPAGAAIRGIAAQVTINSCRKCMRECIEPRHSELSATGVNQHATSIG